MLFVKNIISWCYIAWKVEATENAMNQGYKNILDLISWYLYQTAQVFRSILKGKFQVDNDRDNIMLRLRYTFNWLILRYFIKNN